MSARNNGQFGDLEVGVFDSVTSTFNINAGSTVNLLSSADFSLGAANDTANNTVNQNAGTVTFYADAGTTVGGTGVLFLGKDVGYGQTTGSETYNLNGGTLTLGKVTRNSTAGSGVLNFNGGTLVANADSTDLITNRTRANIRNGAAIVNTNGHAVTINQPLVHSDVVDDAIVDGGLTKSGSGTLIVAGANTYTGNTVVTAGTLRATAPAYSNGAVFSGTAGTDVRGGKLVLD